MIAPYTAALLWAAILAVLLRGPRDWLCQSSVLDRLKKAEARESHDIPLSSSVSLPVNSSYREALMMPFQRPLKKLSIIFSTFVYPGVCTRTRQILFGISLVVWGLIVNHSLTDGDFVTFALLCVPVMLFFVLAFMFVFMSINTIVAFTLVFFLTLSTLLMGGFFAAQVAQESAEFLYGMSYKISDIIGDDASLDKTRQTLLQMVKLTKSGEDVSSNKPNTLERAIHMLYSSSRDWDKNNTKQGFMRAAKGLQSIFSFEDELLVSLEKMDYSKAIWNPFQTGLIANYFFSSSFFRANRSNK